MAENDNTVACEKCGHPIHIGEYPFCPHGWGVNSAHGDECDVWIKHALCWSDGSPRHFTSKAEIARVAKETGWTNVVEHVPSPGSDKNRFGHTQRFV